MERSVVSCAHAQDAVGADAGTPAVANGTADIQRLAVAFEGFSQKAATLQGAYDKLKRHVHAVNCELEDKNGQLQCKIEELDTTRTYLHNVLESMGSGVIAVDTAGRITTFNAAAEQITGYARAEVLGRGYGEVFGERDEAPSAILMSLATRRPHTVKEQAVLCKDGRAVPVGVSSSLLHDANGAVSGAIEIFHDRTEVKALEERVRCADRLAALGQMAATVAHEIRNPLGGIEGFAALLKRDLADRPGECEMASQIVQGARSLNRIVTSLLDYTRPVALQLRAVSVGEVADSALAVIEQEIAASGRRVRVERAYAAADTARVDPEQMSQVVMNLVRNGWQAIQGDGVIEVCTRVADGDVLLHVCDSGCGMGQAIREKLFSPFFTTKETGTGLGLSIVRKIVLAHGGGIEIESVPNEGTTITIRLPRRAGAA